MNLFDNNLQIMLQFLINIKKRFFMQKFKLLKFGLLFLTLLALSACGTKEINPLGTAFGKKDEGDPLRLGANPTPPAKQKSPELVDGSNLVPKSALVPLLRPTVGSANTPITSDFMTLLGPSGAALTVWALAQGNWIWGYTLLDSKSFGDARVWQLLSYPNGVVLIKNAKTLTCLNAYKNGIVHFACDNTNGFQQWKLKPMDNGAVQLENMATKKCIQAPITNPLGDFKVFSIFLSTCQEKDNLDQQWYLTTPPFNAQPLYKEF